LAVFSIAAADIRTDDPHVERDLKSWGPPGDVRWADLLFI